MQTPPCCPPAHDLDLSWLLISRTMDWFEVLWEVVFLIAFLAACYNWRDARLYLQAQRLLGSQGLMLLAPKDWRAANFGLAKAFVGVTVGLVFLLAPSAAIHGPLELVVAGIALRLAFIALGALICATAVNDFVFRRRLLDERTLARLRGRTHETAVPH